jgi:hypothetical protein
VTLKLTTPLPELLALKLPLNVAENESLPAVGTVWVIVSAKVPEALMTLPLPDTNVWKLPKLEPVGVFSEVDPRPVKVSINALSVSPKKVTEFDPLPAQPTHVNMPDVLKVIGSAFAGEGLNPATITSNATANVTGNGSVRKDFCEAAISLSL